MGCSGSKAGKANEIAIKPKGDKSDSGTKPTEKNPPKANEITYKAKDDISNTGTKPAEKNPPNLDPAPQTKQEPLNKKPEVLKPQKSEPEEGFGIIRTVSSKPGYVEAKSIKVPSVEEQVTNWLNLIYSSVKNHL